MTYGVVQALQREMPQQMIGVVDDSGIGDLSESIRIVTNTKKQLDFESSEIQCWVLLTVS